MKTKTFLFIVVLFLFSCGKEKLPFQPKSISELTSNLEGELLHRTQMRLSFAKTIANALENVEFRDYIYRLSNEGTTSYFNEIVFAVHKDDRAVGGKTFEDIMKRYIDNEVKGLFGDEFIQSVLIEDPLIAIKIPDIFYGFDWNTEEYAPLVLAKTPVKLKDKDNLNSYYSYHYSGYQKMMSNHISPEYFSITVKYSEDYILYDKNTKLNEKGVNIFDIVHQVERNWFIMNFEINRIGIPYFSDKRKVFLNKRDIFNAFKNKCEPKKITFGDFSNCTDDCKRDCLIKNEINTVLEKVKLKSLSIDRDTKGSMLFEDNYYLVFFVSVLDNANNPIKVVDKYSITGFRKVEFVNRNLDIKYKQVKINYDDIGEVNLLHIESLGYDFSKFEDKEILINHLIEKGWQGNSYYKLAILNYTQEDLLTSSYFVDNTKFPIPIVYSNASILDEGYIEYCDDNISNYYYGILDFIVKY